MPTTATAHANIALIKYWGKRDEKLFLPTKSSLSVSIPALVTTTTVEINSGHCDTITINNLPATEKDAAPIQTFLDLFRAQFDVHDHFSISTTNSFPTAAGLASSASGFAALAKALNNLYNLNLSPKELSILARQGSGSACRSIQDGFVLWHKGNLPDGSDSYAEQVFDENFWPEFTVIVCVVAAQAKKVSSRAGMQQTVATSPDYAQWLIDSEIRLNKMLPAIKNKDFDTVGALAQADCLDMHACMQTTTPPLNYWTPETKMVMAAVDALRAQGIPCYFTIDAGPNVKILTLKPHAKTILQAISKLPHATLII